MKILLIYLLIINIVCFITMGIDKSRAGKGRRRISEKSFFLLSAIGGAAGTWIGMKIWRHKTKKNIFLYGIPTLLTGNIVTVYLIITMFEISNFR